MEEGIKKQTPDMTLLQVPEGWKQGRGAVLLLKTLPLLVFQLFWNSGNVPPTPGLQGQALPLGLSHDPLDMIRFGVSWEVKCTPPQGQGISEAESFGLLLISSSFWNITSSCFQPEPWF